MRKIAICMAGLLAFLGLLAFPTAVAAAPQLRVTPAEGPNGTTFVLTGTGFEANATYLLRLTFQDGRDVQLSDPSVQSDESGIILESFTFGSALPAGTYPARITTQAGQEVASTTFRLTGSTGAPAPAQITVTPSEGPNETIFILTGTGFEANATYTLRIFFQDGREVTGANPNTTTTRQAAQLRGGGYTAARGGA